MSPYLDILSIYNDERQRAQENDPFYSFASQMDKAPSRVYPGRGFLENFASYAVPAALGGVAKYLGNQNMDERFGRVAQALQSIDAGASPEEQLAALKEQGLPAQYTMPLAAAIQEREQKAQDMRSELELRDEFGARADERSFGNSMSLARFNQEAQDRRAAASNAVAQRRLAMELAQIEAKQQAEAKLKQYIDQQSAGSQMGSTGDTYSRPLLNPRLSEMVRSGAVSPTEAFGMQLEAESKGQIEEQKQRAKTISELGKRSEQLGKVLPLITDLTEASSKVYSSGSGPLSYLQSGWASAVDSEEKVDAQTLKGLSSESIKLMAETLKGSTSDRDLQEMKAAAPSMSKVPEANLQSGRGLYKRAMLEKAAIDAKIDHLSRGGTESSFIQEWEQLSPIVERQIEMKSQLLAAPSEAKEALKQKKKAEWVTNYGTEMGFEREWQKLVNP